MPITTAIWRQKQEISPRLRHCFKSKNLSKNTPKRNGSSSAKTIFAYQHCYLATETTNTWNKTWQSWRDSHPIIVGDTTLYRIMAKAMKTQQTSGELVTQQNRLSFYIGDNPGLWMCYSEDLPSNLYTFLSPRKHFSG